jgi:hypothetical protein
MKKLIVVGVIILLVGISIPSTGNNVEKSFFIREIDAQTFYLDSESFEIVDPKMRTIGSSLSDGNIIRDSEFDDFHPTVAGNAENDFLSCFEVTYNGVDYFPDFWYSLDNGIVWKELGYFSDSEGASFPDLDSNEYGFYGTFGIPPSFDEIWLIIADVPGLINAHIYSWSLDVSLYSMCISCYNHQEFWDFGGIAGTFNTYSEYGKPFVVYPYIESALQLFYMNVQNYFRADFAIDDVLDKSYGVWDNTVEDFLLVLKHDFSVFDDEGHHPLITSYNIIDEGINLEKPSIEAYDNNVVVVAEAEGNINCYYSKNGGSTLFKSTVVESATDPEIMISWDGKIFVCSYVKNDSIYQKLSLDGGASWIDEKLVDQSESTSTIGCHDLGNSESGVYSIWEDDRDGDIDIYFGSVYQSKIPNFSISMKGGIGVKAYIENVGEAPATNINCTMKVEGGKFGLINKTKYYIQENLEVGEDLGISSGMIFGFGKMKIAVSVSCDEGASAEVNIYGTQVLLFSFI